MARAKAGLARPTDSWFQRKRREGARAQKAEVGVGGHLRGAAGQSLTHQGRPHRSTRRPRVRSLLLIPRWLRRSRDPLCVLAPLRLCVERTLGTFAAGAHDDLGRCPDASASALSSGSISISGAPTSSDLRQAFRSRRTDRSDKAYDLLHHTTNCPRASCSRTSTRNRTTRREWHSRARFPG
jgi:hypothetical protein